LALVPLTLGHDEGWPAWTWVCLIAAVPVGALTVAYERWLTRRGGEPLLDLALFRDRAFSAGIGVNFALIFFFGSFMFVLTLLLQLGLGQSPLRAGLETGPLAATFTLMAILGPRVSARVGPRSVTIGGALDIIGTAGVIVTGLHFGGHLAAWDLAPATAVIGLGQGLAMPSLIGAALSGVPAERAGAAAGILTTMQQFGTAAGIAVIGVVFYSRLGPARADSVSAMVLAMTVDLGIVILATGLSFLLPRRSAPRRSRTTGGEPAAEFASQIVH
jgi:Na+/melibiose symporter-like transporter